LIKAHRGRIFNTAGNGVVGYLGEPAMRSIAALVLLSTALFLPASASAEEAAWLAGQMMLVAAHRTDLMPLSGDE
jgi:hypothetical protein